MNGESEDYNEIFKNIVKYDFKIEKKNLTEECKDLITSKIILFTYRITFTRYQNKN